MSRYLFFSLLALSSLVGCGQTVTPNLAPPAPVPLSPAQLAQEGKVEETPALLGSNTTMSFSVPPETLAALLQQTAQREGWTVTEVRRQFGALHVHMTNPRKRDFFGNLEPFYVYIYAREGKSLINLSGIGQFPAEILSPLTTSVQAYLNGGQPLTPEQQQEIVKAAPTTLADIVVTAGPLGQPYQALGEVHVNTVGMINLGSALNDALFRSPLERAIAGPTPTAHIETMNRLLKEKAQEQYGNHVDAIINVVYRTDPSGDVFASGLAVRFAEPQPTGAPARTTEDRLHDLKNLRDKGLISAEEYDQMRSEVLREF